MEKTSETLTLEMIARVAHCGGWANMSQTDALAEICRLSQPWRDSSEKEAVTCEHLETLLAGSPRKRQLPPSKPENP